MENKLLSGYKVDLSQFAKQNALTISAVRLASGLHPDDSNWIPILTTYIDDCEYTLGLEKINQEQPDILMPKSEAEVASIENKNRCVTEVSVHATFQDEYHAMFTWECEKNAIGNYIPEISLDPATEIDRLTCGVRAGTIF